MSGENGTGWSTKDEVARLRRLALVSPAKLLAAYNATQLKSGDCGGWCKGRRWGSLDGPTIRAEAELLARQVLTDGGQQIIPNAWPYVQRLAEAMHVGR